MRLLSKFSKKGIPINKIIYELDITLSLCAYCANDHLSNEYPHLTAKNPKGELLYIWIKTEMYPTIPSVMSIENHKEVIKLSNQYGAIPVFAGMI
jgi:hypothetical protein